MRLIILAVGDRSIPGGAARHGNATAFQVDFINDDMALCKSENAAEEWCPVRGMSKLSLRHEQAQLGGMSSYLAQPEA
ncbi:MAG: hypothetical protein E5V72_32430 [Mesorhizobium sp.]|uniref:hypothetical protein n=1 Tax=unclassified Mesorhizobium TaxID=325217 RepID=UPI000FD3C91A|nr:MULTISPECIES: hypothetical protein [unclassified Mesorhizobium]RUV56559.1 hypothetical protein EOA85_18310 [Mesorhizobium sp. M5C.F.Ca.IN.020.29.1.1]TIM86026.1 MAG: hypothetical protein E5Y50_16770 [Mesorhizobium sp.]TIS68615.1 MAG: hypothetical protein E5W92_05355 [Mesorhizobium sp.]TIW32958.1 MAG: hypothetical protein E5V72_32430 [Mesorhizobium sp.]